MEIGTQVGPYRIDGLIGRGGMAEVYKAWHNGLHRYEALKVLPPEMTFDRSFVERFLAEARMAARLIHPHIVTIHSVSDVAGPTYYFSMELVGGGDLADLLERRGKLSLEEALPLLRQVGEALDFAHQQGVIHRDVKLGNVLLNPARSEEWDVKVVDFGIARAQESGGPRLTRTGTIVGTPEYMSPEQAGSGEKVDHRTDIYSLGIIAYELLCGRPPFQGESDTSPLSVIMSQVRDTPSPPLEYNPALPKAANNAVLKALAKEPDQRFNSCAEFLQALAGAVVVQPPRNTGTVVKNMPANAATAPPRKPSSLAPVMIGVAALVGIGLVATGLHLAGSHSPGQGGEGNSTAQATTGGTASSGSSGGTTSSGSSGGTASSGSTNGADTGHSTGTSSGSSSTSAATTGGTSDSQVTVPDLKNLSEEQARARLNEKSLQAKVTTSSSEKVPAGKVISQSPDAGTFTNPSTTVNLSISTGPTPDTSGTSSGSSTSSSDGRVPNPPPDMEAARKAVRSRYFAWLDAWRIRDLDRYMSFYSPDLVEERANKSYGYDELRQTMSGIWAKQSYVSIQSDNPRITVNGGAVTTTAHQDYDSTTWQDAGTKTLVWKRDSSGAWKIVEERFDQESGGAKQ